jgi:transcription antitermination factor NusG
MVNILQGMFPEWYKFYISEGRESKIKEVIKKSARLKHF